MNTLLIRIALLAIVAGSINVSAQEAQVAPARLGLFVNVDAALSGGSFPGLPSLANCCPEFTSASDIGFLAGLTYIKPLDAALTLHIRMHYWSFGAPFSEQQLLPVIDINGDPSTSTVQHDLTASFKQISVEPLIGYALAENFSALGGITAGYVLAAAFDQKETLVAPADAVFENGRRERNVLDGDIPNASALGFGITLGASYDLALNSDKTIYLSPEILATLSPFDVVQNVSWKIQHIRAGFALSFVPPELQDSLTDQELYEFASGITPPSRVQPGVPFVSTITASAVEPDGSTSRVTEIRVDEFESYHVRPILPYVFFDADSYVIPNRYYRLTSDQRKSFHTDNFYNLDAIVTYRHLLNIIGHRMTEDPDATITLVGHATPEEHGGLELAEERTKAVREYLTDTWNISASRIGIESKGLPENASNNDELDGQAENRRVEIISSSRNILAEVSSTDTVRIVSPTGIRFSTSIDPKVNVKQWTVFLADENAMFSAINGASPVPSTVDWRPHGNSNGIPSGTKELRYMLAVSDTVGAVVPSRTGSIPVVENTLEAKTNSGTSAQRDRYSMILFGFDQAEVSPEHEKVINTIKSKIGPSSRVTVAGHTDRSGSESYNKTLSEKRAKAIANKLGNKVDGVYGYGETLPPFDNNTPEGRFYSRTVEVTVETPKK